MLSGPWHSVFTDVAWNSSTEEAGLGWIMDDEISASQYSATSTHVTSLLLAETLAVLAAMDFALSHGIDSIAVLSDSHILINTIKKKVMKLGIFGVLCDIYHLSTSFKSILFNFVSRSKNVLVDAKAQQAFWALNLS